MKRKLFQSGFTLIELLIVVAIIAILAAIAVPNFLEAQTRAKVSRAKADMRSMATGLESYRVDYNAYPKCNNFLTPLWDPDVAVPAPQGLVLERLSTPIAYMTQGAIPDPFTPTKRTGAINSTTGEWPNPVTASTNPLYKLIKYATPGLTPPDNATGGLQDVSNPIERASYMYILISTGPDQTYPNLGGILAPAATEQAVANNIYDPTNGTISSGSVYRIGGVTTGTTNYGGRFYDVVSRLQR